jgi:CRISPR system Cascade subunit CasE
MSERIVAYASVLRLSRHDIKVLKIKDAYALHKVIYSLFEDVRTDVEKQASISSGIVYADKGGDFNTRQILMLSNRKPHQTPQFGEVQSKPIHADFLTYERYAFDITINPTKRDKQSRKIIPIKGRAEIAAWFTSRALQSWGFEVNAEHLQISQMGVQVFERDGKSITHSSVSLKGELIVTEQENFARSFIKGIGRGRAFGFGLLQVVPLSSEKHNLF